MHSCKPLEVKQLPDVAVLVSVKAEARYQIDRRDSSIQNGSRPSRRGTTQNIRIPYQVTESIACTERWRHSSGVGSIAWIHSTTSMRIWFRCQGERSRAFYHGSGLAHAQGCQLARCDMSQRCPALRYIEISAKQPTIVLMVSNCI